MHMETVTRKYCNKDADSIVTVLKSTRERNPSKQSVDIVKREIQRYMQSS